MLPNIPKHLDLARTARMHMAQLKCVRYTDSSTDAPHAKQ